MPGTPASESALLIGKKSQKTRLYSATVLATLTSVGESRAGFGDVTLDVGSSQPECTSERMTAPSTCLPYLRVR